ncbi:MAG: discoidin domain-containing protein [Collinsella sp.]
MSHALDGNPATIWHSNWQSVTAENASGDLKVSKMIYAEFDFDKGYDITQFSFTPRGDVGSGFITKATLKVKNTANGEYKTVATDQVFRADSKKKTFIFDEQTVYGIRLEITDANEHGGHKYVAVSEFDIANTPARTNTVYAHGKSYAAGTDGALDLATGKAAGQIAGSAEDLDASKPVYRAEVRAAPPSP